MGRWRRDLICSGGVDEKTALRAMYKTAADRRLTRSLDAVAQLAELAELVDALDSGSSVRKNFRVQVPGSAYFKILSPVYGLVKRGGEVATCFILAAINL